MVTTVKERVPRRHAASILAQRAIAVVALLALAGCVSLPRPADGVGLVAVAAETTDRSGDGFAVSWIVSLNRGAAQIAIDPTDPVAIGALADGVYVVDEIRAIDRRGRAVGRPIALPARFVVEEGAITAFPLFLRLEQARNGDALIQTVAARPATAQETARLLETLLTYRRAERWQFPPR